jgi:hypothetical protein
MWYYGDRVLPRLVNAACGMKANEPLRRRVCEGLHGNVVEIGFGSGHNVPFYPSAILIVTAIEPADLAWELAPTAWPARPFPCVAAASTGSGCRSWTTARTPRCRPGRCAPSRTSPRPSPSSAVS